MLTIALACTFVVGILTVSQAATTNAGCFTSPSSCGYPDATNTGVPAGTVLTKSSSRTISQNGAVVNGLEINGTVTVTADNVTIENSRINVPTGGNGSYGVILNSGADNFTIVNSEVTGPASESTGIESAVWNHYNNPGATARRSYFHHCADCWEGAGTFEDDYMVVDAGFSGAHKEDIYACGTTVNVNHSTLFNIDGQTATVFGDTICGPNQFTVTNSLLAGGGYLVYPQANSKSSVGTMNVSHNRFARCLGTKSYSASSGGTVCAGGTDANGYYPLGGYYGVAAYTYTGGSNVWTDNVWDDSSQPVCPSGSAGCGSAWSAPTGTGTTTPPPTGSEPEPKEEPAPPVEPEEPVQGGGEAPAPTPVQAIWTAPTGAKVGTPVVLDGTASTGVAPLSCLWTIEYKRSNATRTGCRVEYAFTAAGTVPVTLTVTDAGQAHATSRQAVAVTETSTRPHGGNSRKGSPGSPHQAEISSGAQVSPTTTSSSPDPVHAIWRAPRNAARGRKLALDARGITGRRAVSCAWTIESARGGTIARRRGCHSSYRPSRSGTVFVRLTVRGSDGSGDTLRRPLRVG